MASPQAPIVEQATPYQAVVVNKDLADEVAPISPTKSPGPMSLEACLELGFEHQPALHAAQASLDAANSGQNGLHGLPRFARFKAPDLPIRKQQSALGVTIADATLIQARHDTRYSITRNFFTVQYIRAQQKVVGDVLKSLEDGYKKAKTIVDKGDPETKLTTLDLKGIKVQVGIVKAKKAQADAGMLTALAALREAMGLRHDWPLEIAVADLPPAVYEVKSVVKGKDAKGKPTETLVTEFRPLYKFNRDELIAAAVANRGEMTQASAATQVAELEIAAQGKIRSFQGRTFSSGADIHVQPIPQGVFNNVYRPGAIGLEMPGQLAGRKGDRQARASDLSRRADAVLDKTTNLVSLDVEAQYLKWQEAVDQIQSLKDVYDIAQGLPAEVYKIVQGKDLTGGAIIQANLTAVLVRTQLNEELHIHALALAGLERATAGAFKVYPVPAAPK
ncbi:MAG: TolC family protein [Gemmataceae bacterium]|nr:TolC family protein [Gemmataceae bacterium]